MTQAYRYEALDSRGKLRSGVVECEGEDEAVDTPMH